MKKVTTRFARGVVYLTGFAALAVCFILLPELAREDLVERPTELLLVATYIGTAYLLATPFFIALYQTHKLLRTIDENKVFSNQSIKILQIIKMCAIAFSVIIAVVAIGGVSWLRIMNPQEDAPPFIMLGFVLTLVSSVIAVFVAVLQKLVAEAITLKSENDLIV